MSTVDYCHQGRTLRIRYIWAFLCPNPGCETFIEPVPTLYAHHPSGSYPYKGERLRYCHCCGQNVESTVSTQWYRVRRRVVTRKKYLWLIPTDVVTWEHLPQDDGPTVWRELEPEDKALHKQAKVSWATLT